MTEVVPGPIAGLFAGAPPESRTSEWTKRWAAAEHAAADVARNWAAADPGELGIVARLIEQMAASGQALNLVVSNSMPVRDGMR